jgi:hypothetical protein
MARARRAPFNRQGLEFKTASLQRAARLFGTAFTSSPFEEATTEKVQSRLSFARQTALRGVTAAVVGLLLAAFYDPAWTAEILTKLDYALAAAALSAIKPDKV